MRLSFRSAPLAALLLSGLTMVAAPAPPDSPAPGLNHFYVVLDHDTYAAIEQSAVMKTRFAAFEQRTTVRTDKTYTGIYFYGHETYMEFLDASTSGRHLGDSGMAFGDDVLGGKSLIEGAKPMLVTREWNGTPIPWFFMTTPSWESGGEAGFVTWFMQYHADFLAKWHPEARPSAAPTSRASVLERYKAVLPATPSQPLLGDVAGLTLALKAESRARFEAWMKSLGDTFPVRLVDPGAGNEGIRAAEFRLDRAPEKEETLRFGSRSTLTLRRDRTARWRFE
jgi:hypothetical protein